MLNLDTAPVHNDVLPLSRRYQIMTVIRLGFVVAVCVSCTLFGAGSPEESIVASVVYAIWSGASLFLLKRSNATSVISNAGLVVDGVFLEWILLTHGSWATELW